MRSGEETVAASEKNSEKRQGKSSGSFPNRPELPSKVEVGRVSNFTCPACQEVLPEAVTINGKVSGWCGNTHTYISVPII